MRRLRELAIDDPLRPSAGPPIGDPVSATAGNGTNGSATAARGVVVAVPGESEREPVVDVAHGRLRRVAIDRIVPNARQPRGRFDEQQLQALAVSIGERGVLQPPVVRETREGRLELIAGERRWRAARLAGVTELDVLVREADAGGSLQDALAENVLREDLSPVEASAIALVASFAGRGEVAGCGFGAFRG
jgi:ParB family transcriptional regulator, chromosome partitioning protein